jgi:hypothetical protein
LSLSAVVLEGKEETVGVHGWEGGGEGEGMVNESINEMNISNKFRMFQIVVEKSLN